MATVSVPSPGSRGPYLPLPNADDNGGVEAAELNLRRGVRRRSELNHHNLVQSGRTGLLALVILSVLVARSIGSDGVSVEAMPRDKDGNIL